MGNKPPNLYIAFGKSEISRSIKTQQSLPSRKTLSFPLIANNHAYSTFVWISKGRPVCLSIRTGSNTKDSPLQKQGDRRGRREEAVSSGEFYLSLVGKAIVAGEIIRPQVNQVL